MIPLGNRNSGFAVLAMVVWIATSQQFVNGFHLRRPCHSQLVGESANEPTSTDATTTTNYNWTRQNLRIAIPALIGMLADPLLSLMDTAYVGHLGTTELAALGACTSIFHLAFNAFRATTQATTSLVATSLQKDPKQAQQVTSISLKLGFVMGLCVMAFLQLGGTWCLGTMGVPVQSKLYAPAKAYLSTRAWAAPIVLGIVVSEGAFRGYGDTKIPLLASLAASLINLVLDPILMFPLGLGVMGAAAATALSQLGAGAVYAFFLNKRHMLGGSPNTATGDAATDTDIMTATTPGTTSDESIQAIEIMEDPPTLSDDDDKQRDDNKHGGVQQGKVIRAILSANLAMMTKQGSLLLAWAYATSRATRIGANHVAAHQVALSCWLVLALMLDGAGVSAQVLMSRACAQKNVTKRKKEVKSLISYFTRFATLQGATACFVWLTFLGRYVVPHVFTSDGAIRAHLISLMPTLAWQLILVSLTLVVEAMAVGGHQFQIMAFGTTISTILAMSQLQHATNIVSIWSRGINTLFYGRLATAIIATFRVFQLASKPQKGDDDYKES
ncbi:DETOXIFICATION 44, chloroplastic [Seminavis robusta]|uniref:DETOXIFICATION 44, chloroplastic n=1 Tax=Seminavis robusta TaxID=568900 RepID=A0A9N8HFB0_9STRA|nr:DETOXIFICATION 44, chloroplastic [Seminavis robusta]|eukprot:Sro560_g166610.1 DETOXIFICATION 44, chloroplastic (557) ;mRNA; f:7895-9781